MGSVCIELMLCVTSILRLAVIPLVLSEELARSGWLILTEVSEANLRASGTGCAALSDKELNILHRDSHVKRILAVVHLIRTGGAVVERIACALMSLIVCVLSNCFPRLPWRGVCLLCFPEWV
jgi:hypothetical protein